MAQLVRNAYETALNAGKLFSFSYGTPVDINLKLTARVSTGTNPARLNLNFRSPFKIQIRFAEVGGWGSPGAQKTVVAGNRRSTITPTTAFYVFADAPSGTISWFIPSLPGGSEANAFEFTGQAETNEITLKPNAEYMVEIKNLSATAGVEIVSFQGILIES